MSDYNYDIIKHSVIEWYEKVTSECKSSGDIVTALSKNTDEVLMIDFDFPNCAAQLSVNNSQFVPYQFVYFEAMNIAAPGLEEAEQIYCFYDDSTMRKSDVIDALNDALLFCSAYKKV